MPPGKQTIPIPIDRPLSRAYLRGFTGWSTAYPPGQSEPTSLRVMENVMVNRNGALATRPGLRYLSYKISPDMDPSDDNYPGEGFDRPLVGGQEPFYTLSGEKALLFAVREEDETVGFRAILMTNPFTAVYRLTDPEIDFEIPQGESVMNFSKATTHVEYLQINNRIIAMSDAGEDVRVFFVGLEKVVKRMSNVSVPDWTDADKLSVIHPDGGWVSAQTTTIRTNELLNPSFEIGTYAWTPLEGTRLAIEKAEKVSGERSLRIESRPMRTNMITYPLQDLASLPENSLIEGWYPLEQAGHETRAVVDHGYLRIYDNIKSEGPFLAYSSKAWFDVTPREKYRLAFDYTLGADVVGQARLSFHSVNGAKIGNDVVFELPKDDGRWASPAVPAPDGTVTIRAWIGGTALQKAVTYIRVKDVVLCPDGEDTTAFHGGSGANFFWTGTVNQSASVFHPPRDVEVRSARVSIPQRALAGSMSLRSSAAKYCSVDVRLYDRVDGLADTLSHALTLTPDTWERAAATTTLVPAGVVASELRIKVASLGHGEAVLADAGMLESNTSTAGTYFDGETVPTEITANTWLDRSAPHASPSQQRIMPGASMPWPATPTENTLMATGGADKNPYKIGVFYTFENEVGESAPSKVTEVRVSRDWANWRWETANAASEPSGTPTDVAELCADQLVVRLPQAVYEQALAEGAVKWHLYALSWSDQEPVPPVGDRMVTRDMLNTELTDSLPYLEGGLIYLTPSRRVGFVSQPLPSRVTRVNYSTPPQSRNGLVAGDRLILVGDPTKLATIKWSSNSFGEYTNFSAAAGGGEKTLTSGNLNLPVAVVLWQNPQSVDTITILCQGEDGYSSAHYMAPATVQSGSGTTSIMGFEETTNTPGTLSPYAVEVMNNALFRPTMMALLKSSAQNYNINHKTFSDKIANMWQGLQSRGWMMSAQLDNRLYLLVNNPRGAALEEGCRGNEIWVLDIAAENGNWSRLLVQAAALRPFDIGGTTYLGVTRPEGLYYLDPDYRRDDWVGDLNEVFDRSIPWRFETNTQGANRAHDGWAHVQQVQVTFGAFNGKARYGIRGLDLNGLMVDTSKEFADERLILDSGYEWSIHDRMRVARDLMEWVFYAESLPDVDGTGLVAVVQYRYTPVSVNVGTEFGSVESFEYGRNVADGPDMYSANGTPLSYTDYSRT
jgi:hypothetical protein